MHKKAAFILSIVVAVASCTLSGCGGGGSSGSSPIQAPASYTLGGTVTGLSGSGLVLADNGGDNLAVGANGSFVFSSSVAAGDNYLVSVLAQPSSPAQSCVVKNATGAAAANASNIQVTCTAVSPVPASISTAPGEWTWAGGSSIADQAGVYGALGVPAPANIPGARSGAVAWTDSSGNLWLFGGAGPEVGGGCALLNPLCWAGTNSYFNDLWKFDGQEWTWVAGSNSTDQSGVYGTLGKAAPGNAPGARYGAVSWTDSSGNLWLFGGAGYDSTGNTGYLNDLWEFSNGEWTWMGGSNLANAMGNYGTEDVAASTNIPGARAGAVGLTDSLGNFWLFAGQGCASFCGAYLDDLWEYSKGQWTWVSGDDAYSSTPPTGVYGTLGTPAPGNQPGGRENPGGWTDPAGNLWILGGAGWGSWSGNVADLNDLWKFSGGQWTWIGGPSETNSEIDATGTYGTLGTPASGNIPGSRYDAMSWTDANGNLWLFGGQGFGATSQSSFPDLNDLWKYSGGMWTWMSGSNTGGQAGAYGTLGSPSPANLAGARINAVTWTDAKGNLWLFGGNGLDSSGIPGLLNDLWVYQPQ